MVSEHIKFLDKADVPDIHAGGGYDQLTD